MPQWLPSPKWVTVLIWNLHLWQQCVKVYGRPVKKSPRHSDLRKKMNICNHIIFQCKLKMSKWSSLLEVQARIPCFERQHRLRLWVDAAWLPGVHLWRPCEERSDRPKVKRKLIVYVVFYKDKLNHKRLRSYPSCTENWKNKIVLSQSKIYNIILPRNTFPTYLQQVIIFYIYFEF